MRLEDLPTVSISIVCHNNQQLTARCIDSIAKNSDLSKIRFILTDSGSTDSTRQYFHWLSKNPYLKVELIEFSHNVGFIKGHNSALCRTYEDYFLVLNNDIEIVDDKWWLLKMLVEFERDSKLAICGAAGACCTLTDDFVGRPGDRVEYVEGSCLVIPTKLAKQLKGGLFDKSFRHGTCDDSDLSLRVRELGYNIKTVPIGIVHERAATRKIVQDYTDVEGYEAYNRAICLDRWKIYLKRRNFEYEILVIRKGAAGDVLLTTPIIRALKQRYPKASITVRTLHPDIYKFNPNIHKAVEEASEEDFDIVYDLDNAYESSEYWNIVQNYFRKTDLASHDEKPEIYFSVEDNVEASSKLQGNWIAVHGDRIRLWEGKHIPESVFNKIIQSLRTAGWKVVLVGQDINKLDCDLDTRTHTTVNQMAAIISKVRFFIGQDSLPMHIAEAFGVPGIAVFGATNPSVVLVHNSSIRPFQAEAVGCLGCYHLLPRPKQFSTCFRTEEFCMTKLDPELILKQAEAILWWCRRA